MSPALAEPFAAELAAAGAAEAGGELDRAWRALERAHVLSQLYAVPHLRVHFLMAAFAWRRATRPCSRWLHARSARCACTTRDAHLR